jgi:hypothetical protein
MITQLKSSINASGPVLVYSNPGPKREPQFPAIWRLYARGRGEFNIIVTYHANHPCLVYKEAG